MSRLKRDSAEGEYPSRSSERRAITHERDDDGKRARRVATPKEKEKEP